MRIMIAIVVSSWVLIVVVCSYSVMTRCWSCLLSPASYVNILQSTEIFLLLSGISYHGERVVHFVSYGLTEDEPFAELL